MTVRTRIAPSPTGAPHIGTAYIALFNYAYAHAQGGQYLLRIEDTDQTRSTTESETDILNALKWLGLDWDEGPDTGGPYGPYRQSERLAIYQEHAQQLVESGKAYPCFCTRERLDSLRKEQMAAKTPLGYDGHCAQLDPAESATRVAAGEEHVIRMKTPDEGDCAFTDRFRGEISIPWSQIDEQVLLKSDGFPTYHLANVVDDHLMKITDVIRGEEWINSTPKHILLYRYFGWTAPNWAHLPLLRNPDKSKLSKRKNPTGILYYRDAGFLPETILNYLGLMAYSPADGNEKFSLQDLCAGFDLDRVHLGSPVFDLQKLRHFNGLYLRDLTPSELLERLKDWRLNDEFLLSLLPLVQPRLETLSDTLPKSGFLFADQLPLSADDLPDPIGDEGPSAARLLKRAQWKLETPGPWTTEHIRLQLETLADQENLKLKKLLGLFFIAMSGSKVSLPLFDSMALMGRELCLRRIQYALEALTLGQRGLSGKQLKKLEKEVQAIDAS